MSATTAAAACTSQPFAAALSAVREKRCGCCVSAAAKIGLSAMLNLPSAGRHLLYLLGQPGSGKSTLAAHLTEGVTSVEMERPFAHRLYPDCELVELGARREKFSGTDALPMNVQPKIVAWLNKGTPPFVLAEGDRLANRKFFDSAVAAGWHVRVAYLSLHSSIAAERRRAREVKLGTSPQNATWLKGRITKARKLAQEWPDVYLLNADLPAEMMAEQLRRYSDPVVSALDAARTRG